MKFMKGLDAPTMIAIIIAVIAGLIILYFLWSKGMLPWLGGATEAQCHTDLSKVCGGQLLWTDSQIRVTDKSCWTYFRGDQQDTLKNCLESVKEEGSDPSSKCDDFCRLFQGG